MDKIAARHDEDPVRKFVFEPGGVNLRGSTEKRKRGRPRLRWASKPYELYEELIAQIPFITEAGAAVDWGAPRQGGFLGVLANYSDPKNQVGVLLTAVFDKARMNYFLLMKMIVEID